MRTSSTIGFTGAVLTTFLFAFCAFARDHAALNGTWILVAGKSDFAGQPARENIKESTKKESCLKKEIS